MNEAPEKSVGHATLHLFFFSCFLLFIGQTELGVACPEFNAASLRQTTSIYVEFFSERKV